MYNKYFAILIHIFCFIFLSFSLSHAFNTAPPTLRFGYIPGYGFAQDLSVASERGYIYQTLKRMENYSTYKFTFTAYDDVQSIQQALEDNKVDVILPFIQNSKLAERFMYGQKAVGTAQVVLVAKGIDYAYYNDPAQINGKTIASYHGSALEPYLDDYCKKNGFKINYIRGDLLKYHELKADYYLVSSLSDVFHDYDSIINLSAYDYYALYRKDGNKIIEELLNSNAMVREADAKLMHQLYLRYYNTNLTRRDLTKTEMLAIKDKTFTVGYIGNHPPLQYTDKNGQASGIAVEILDLLAKRYGFKVNYIPYSLRDPKQFHESFDILISLLGDYHHENTHYRITEQYFSQPLMLITSKNDAIIKNFKNHKRSIGILNYIAVPKEAVLEEYPKAEVQVFDTLNSMTLAFDRGEIDAMLTTSTALPYFNSVFGDTLFTFGNDLNLPFQLYISRKLNPIYVNIFNVIFDYVDPAEFEEIVTRQTLEFLPSFSFSEGLRIYRFEIITAALVLLFLFIVTILYLRNKQKLAVLDVLKYDTLSGFENYSFFEKKVAKTMRTVHCKDYEILSVDIDAFSAIATHYNYEVANDVLKTMSEALDEHLKGKSGLITRTFADNFTLLCKSKDTEEIVNIVQEKIIPKLKAILEENYPLTLSLGAYPITNCSLPVHLMVDRANLAKAKGKGEHRTTFYIFDQSMMQYYDTRLNVTYRMENALKDNEFNLVFQPKIEFKTLTLIGAEALVRWRTSTDEIIYPNDFIPIFEENGFIVKLDIYVFTKVCRFIKENEHIIGDRLVSVNISNRTMLEPTIVGRLKMIVDNFEIDPKNIELEITESAMCEDFCMNKLQEFQALGFVISIDDFGAGVSSLNRLGNMNADVIKLDKTFLDLCSDNPKAKVVVQDTISMAKHLNMKVVAEGVETAEQALWLQGLECDIAQGYYFAKPVNVTEFLAQVKENKVFIIKK